MQYNVLVLEDSKARIEQFKNRFAELRKKSNNEFDVAYVNSVDKFLKAIVKKKYDLIFLDHDLDDKVFVESTDPNTGGYLASYLSDKPELLDKAKIIIHSLNPQGAEYMQRCLPSSTRIPFLWVMGIFHTHIKVPNAILEN